jgi:twitching motility protein PilT
MSDDQLPDDIPSPFASLPEAAESDPVTSVAPAVPVAPVAPSQGSGFAEAALAEAALAESRPPEEAVATGFPANAPAPISTAPVHEPPPFLPPEEPGEKKGISIHSLLKGLVKHGASDLHVKVGRPPLYRINGKLLPAKLPPLENEEVAKLAYSTMTPKQIKEFEENLQIDFGYLVPGLARFRANVFMQKGTLAFVIRVVPLQVPVIENLGLPPVIAELALKQRGLLLVTGATGAGKSTTLAAIVEHINRNVRAHVVTIEDPIEFIYEDKMSTVSQREVGVDAVSLAGALRGALRQDPDVIVVGEMRDFDTIRTAITAAETGHLVISTMHTSSAAQSIDRIVDSFPADAKNQLRMQLASSVLAVVSQRLVKRADGKGRVVACEVLTKSPTVEKLIAENRLNELEGTMESSNTYYKMQSMNQALVHLVKSGVVAKEEACLNSDKREDLILKLSGMMGASDPSAAHAEMEADAPTDPLIRRLKEAKTKDESTSTSGIQVEGQVKVKRPPAGVVPPKKRSA